jgi:DUF438 domain-containing protein
MTDNETSRERISMLKSLIKKIDSSKDVNEARMEISSVMNSVPYDDVVSAEQELIEEGMPQEKMLELCDLHSNALKGIIDQRNIKPVPAGHPVHTFRKENQALQREISFARNTINKINGMQDQKNAGELFIKLHSNFNQIMDVDKHYLRKEHLLFPFLEKYKITGPPTVMWGKHDQIRELLKNSIEVLNASHHINADEGKIAIELSLVSPLQALEDMIYKEEEILFPMCLDTLNENDWYEIYRQAEDYGYCLYEPADNWNPEGVSVDNTSIDFSKIPLPTGSFNLTELTAIFNTLPVDITFVDKDDKVRFFSLGKERIFQRSKAVIGRKVQFCHPPSSVNVVNKILDDFRTGKQDKASFWINMRGKFIYISYYALRNEMNEYLGTLEVTQDLTELRMLEGERRILSYEEN